MKNLFPIYIPSKGRAYKCTTPRILLNEGIPFNLVVEPQDDMAYREAFRLVPSSKMTLVVLPKNNQGLFYSRQFIKNWSSDYSYHWQLDDDIRSFLGRIPGESSRKIPANEALCMIEDEVLKYTNIGQAGMNQNSFPPGKSPIKINNLPVQAFLVNNKVQAKFRTPILNDFDFTLQVLREGWCTLMFDHIRTNTPAIGTNPGGLHEVYKKRAVILETMKFMCDEFGTMTIDEDEKGPHLRKNRIFSTFKQQPSF